MTETDLAKVWARSLDELAEMHIEPAQRAWLQLTRPLGLVENTALIATPNEFVKEQLETRLRALITNALSRELGRSIQLAVTVDPTAVTPMSAGFGPGGGHAKLRGSRAAPTAARAAQAPGRARARPRHGRSPGRRHRVADSAGPRTPSRTGSPTAARIRLPAADRHGPRTGRPSAPTGRPTRTVSLARQAFPASRPTRRAGLSAAAGLPWPARLPGPAGLPAAAVLPGRAGQPAGPRGPRLHQAGRSSRRPARPAARRAIGSAAPRRAAAAPRAPRRRGSTRSTPSRRS